MKLNASARTNQLPLSVYESLIEMEGGKTKLVFSGLPYTLATEEAERIGVDHIARVSVIGSTETSAGKMMHDLSAGSYRIYLRQPDLKLQVYHVVSDFIHHLMRELVSHSIVFVIGQAKMSKKGIY